MADLRMSRPYLSLKRKRERRMLRLFRIGETEIKCSISLIIAGVLAVILGRETEAVIAFVSLTVHEAAHAMLAFRLGYPVRSVEIQPFGFVARLDCTNAPPIDLAAVYAAGPVASITMAAFSSLMESMVPEYAAAKLGLTEYNLLIAAVNMLPAMPLDGGRLLYSAFSSKSQSMAMRALKICGVIAGIVFLTMFVIMLVYNAVNLTFAVMGVFLIIAAIKEPIHVNNPISRKRFITGRSSVPVRVIAASEGMSISKAMSMLPAGSYAVLNVIDEELRRIAVIDEKQLMEAAKKLGASAKLSDAVALYRGMML